MTGMDERWMGQQSAAVRVVSTAKISGKHQQAMTTDYPHVRFSFFDHIEQAATALPDAEVMITYGEDLDEERIAQCRQLRWIHVISAGLEKMPFQAISARGIRVTNARGIHAVPMSEYTLAVMLQITRRTDQLRDLQRDKRWDRTIRVGELAGQTLLVLGAGAIGQAIAQKAQAFAMTTIGVNTDGRETPHFDRMVSIGQLHLVLGLADFIVLTVPQTPETVGLIGREELRKMKPTATLINLARGAVVDEVALLDALRERTIAQAVLDVFQQEPLPAAHPFWELDNVILTPHLSGRSPRYMTRALEGFRRNLDAYLRGAKRMENEIDAEKGY
ncbi:D-2-hydroxyacid dehydrogenase [Laceyella tengchongensis]|jgi:phosphoglycerate dehydrogenase-like enzyme|nr:D-2-hydroxyacid dehydrogenase [Laceyella tengchongensis]